MKKPGQQMKIQTKTSLLIGGLDKKWKKKEKKIKVKNEQEILNRKKNRRR